MNSNDLVVLIYLIMLALQFTYTYLIYYENCVSIRLNCK